MRVWWPIALCLLASACSDLAMKPGDKPMARREIPPGPGLFTGPEGEFVIYRLEKSQPGADGATEATTGPVGGEATP